MTSPLLCSVLPLQIRSVKISSGTAHAVTPPFLYQRFLKLNGSARTVTLQPYINYGSLRGLLTSDKYL